MQLTYLIAAGRSLRSAPRNARHTHQRVATRGVSIPPLSLPVADAERPPERNRRNQECLRVRILRRDYSSFRRDDVVFLHAHMRIATRASPESRRGRVLYRRRTW